MKQEAKRQKHIPTPESKDNELKKFKEDLNSKIIQKFGKRPDIALKTPRSAKLI